MSIAVFICFSWTVFNFFHKLSSFLLYFTLGEIAAVFAYMMAFALLESLAATGLLLLLSIVLPPHWLKQGFSYKGFVILVIATIDALLLQKSLQNVFPSLPELTLFLLLPLALSGIVIGVLHSKPNVQDMLVKIEDRFLVMMFLYIPIGVISLVAVTFRNLF